MRSTLLVLVACSSLSLPVLSQAQTANDADRLQKQCGSVDHYDKLPPTQAKECKAWEAEQEERAAEIHAGGIEEANLNAMNAAANAFTAAKPLLARLTPAQRTAYKHLFTAFQAFMTVQVSGGALYPEPYALPRLDDGGDYASEYLHARFDTSVVRAILHRTDLPGRYDDSSPNDPPTGSPLPSLEEADAKLNQAWQSLAMYLGTTHKTDQLERLRNEQRAWLSYRDNFTVFAVTVSPNLPRSVWLACMEANRAEELTELERTMRD